MKLDLSKIILDNPSHKRVRDDYQTKKIEKQYTVEPEFTVFSCIYGDYEVIRKKPIALDAVNMGNNKIHIRGDVELTLGIPCDRCLEIVSTDINFVLSLELDFSDEQNEDMEDQSFVDGRVIDIDGMLYPEILINLPSKVLSSEDCKGICKVCGKNLNEEGCGSDTFVADPRMAAINDIFKNFNNK